MSIAFITKFKNIYFNESYDNPDNRLKKYTKTKQKHII